MTDNELKKEWMATLTKQATRAKVSKVRLFFFSRTGLDALPSLTVLYCDAHRPYLHCSLLLALLHSQRYVLNPLQPNMISWYFSNPHGRPRHAVQPQWQRQRTPWSCLPGRCRQRKSLDTIPTVSPKLLWLPLHPNVQAPGVYTIVRPQGNGVINLTAQHVHTCKTVRETIPRMEAKLAFENAFPDTIMLSHYILNTLVNIAHDLGFTGLELALCFDPQVSGPLAPMVCSSHCSLLFIAHSV